MPAAVRRIQARISKTIAVELIRIEAMIQAMPRFAELAEITESVSGIGRTTSAALIAAMPELGQANNKIVAALLGLAPYDATAAGVEVSGTSRADVAGRATCSIWPVFPRYPPTDNRRPRTPYKALF